MWDNSRRKEEWAMEQLIARYQEMWGVLTAAVEDQTSNPMTPEMFEDSHVRETVGTRAMMIRKVAWEMGNVAEEWRRRDGETRQG